jgi:hypothetical protein
MTEINYNELATLLECSPRHARRIVRANGKLIQPIMYGYRKVKFKLSDAVLLKDRIRKEAVSRGRDLVIKIKGGAR